MTKLPWMLMFLAASQSSGSVSGQVTDAATKSPIAGARIILVPMDGMLAKSLVGQTNEQGRFTVGNVPPGLYQIVATDLEYVRHKSSTLVAITEGRASANIAIAMTRTAVVTGRVYNEHGEPAPNVFVRAWTKAGQVAEAKTNDLGEYRLFGLEPAAYVISAERYLAPRIEGAAYLGPTPPCPDCPGEGEFRQQVAALLKTGAYLDPRVILGRTYPAVFYPAATDRAGATPVDARSGVTAGIDLRLVVR